MRCTPSLHSLAQRAALAAVILVSAACGMLPAERDYRAASKLGTEQAFRDYLAKYPEGYLSHKVAYGLAYRANSIPALQEFVARYPDSKEATSARTQIADLERNQEMDAIFAAAGANDVLPLIQKYDINSNSRLRLVRLIEEKWQLVPADEEKLVRTLAIDPILNAEKLGGNVTALRGADHTVVTVYGNRNYTALSQGVYFEAWSGPLLYVESLVINNKPYGRFAYAGKYLGKLYTLK